MADNEEYEILDLSALRRDNSWLNGAIRDISKQSAAKQVAIGGASGWVAGYLFVKVGKVAAATVGASIILMQIAYHKGYLRVNKKLVERDMKDIMKRVENEADALKQKFIPDGNEKRLRRKMSRLFQQNMFLVGGFAGGFLIGMAF